MNKENLAKLRKQAEKILGESMNAKGELIKEVSKAEMAEILNELRVYQIELEMQNEELQASHIELERVKDKYWQLFNQSPSGYIILDQNSMIAKVNYTFMNMVGKNPDSLLGKSFTDLIFADDQAVFLARYKGFFANPKGKTMELRLKTSTNNVFWALISGTTFSEDEKADKPIKLLLNIIDIDIKKELESRQKTIEERMNQLQRFESLGILAGGIAHEFNNLLTIIRGNSELASISENVPEKVKKFLAEIVSSTDRAAKLTGQMLSYAGQGSVERRTLNLADEILQLSPLMRSTISSNCSLKMDIAQNCFINFDQNQLQQILMNAMLNASEAIPKDEEGKVIIKTSFANPESNAPEQIAYAPESFSDSYVCLEITDNGCGMSQEIIEHIFEPFYSTKFTGRGLGMASVLGIIKKHEGAIAVSSEIGKGSTFKFYLPARQEQKAEVAPEQNKQSHREAVNSKYRGKVLITEDEPIIRRLMVKLLRDIGLEACAVSNGLEGVELLDSGIENLRFAILDLVMPKMSGKDFFKILRARHPKLPVVFCSGYSINYIPEEIRKDPYFGFVNKPFSWRAIEREIIRLGVKNS